MKTTVSDDRAFIEHIIDKTVLESSIAFIKDRFTAEEIYGSDELGVWALENGFTPDKEVEELEEEIEELKKANATLVEDNKVLQNNIDELNE